MDKGLFMLKLGCGSSKSCANLQLVEHQNFLVNCLLKEINT